MIMETPLHSDKKPNYQLLFFASFVVNIALGAGLLFFVPHCSGPACVPVPNLLPSSRGAPEAPHEVQQVAHKIASLNSHSITVSWLSAATFGSTTITYAVDANTSVFREVLKDPATLAQESQDFQKKLLASGLPLLPPVTYTLVPASYSDLKPGMSVSVETVPNPSGTSGTAVTASRILIVPDAPVPPATSTK